MTSTSTAAERPGAQTGSVAQQERRQRILDATVELASEGGYEAVQMRTVAERAGVALGTLYRYFPSKIHLLVTVLGRSFTGAEKLSGTRPVPGDTPQDRIMFIMRRTTRMLQKQPKVTEALVRAFMFADSSVAEEIDVVGIALTNMLTRAITGSPEQPDPTEEQANIVRVISDVWFSSLVGWVTGRVAAKDVERSVDVAVELLFR